MGHFLKKVSIVEIVMIDDVLWAPDLNVLVEPDLKLSYSSLK